MLFYQASNSDGWVRAVRLSFAKKIGTVLYLCDDRDTRRTPTDSPDRFIGFKLELIK